MFLVKKKKKILHFYFFTKGPELEKSNEKKDFYGMEFKNKNYSGPPIQEEPEESPLPPNFPNFGINTTPSTSTPSSNSRLAITQLPKFFK